MMYLANRPVPTAPIPRHLWAVLLAGGDGIRLRDLTRKIVGDYRPKQFCPIVGEESLLSQTRARLSPLFSDDRQVFVVSAPMKGTTARSLRTPKTHSSLHNP